MSSSFLGHNIGSIKANSETIAFFCSFRFFLPVLSFSPFLFLANVHDFRAYQALKATFWPFFIFNDHSYIIIIIIIIIFVIITISSQFRRYSFIIIKHHHYHSHLSFLSLFFLFSNARPQQIIILKVMLH